MSDLKIRFSVTRRVHQPAQNQKRNCIFYRFSRNVTKPYKNRL